MERRADIDAPNFRNWSASNPKHRLGASGKRQSSRKELRCNLISCTEYKAAEQTRGVYRRFDTGVVRYRRRPVESRCNRLSRRRARKLFRDKMASTSANGCA